MVLSEVLAVYKTNPIRRIVATLVVAAWFRVWIRKQRLARERKEVDRLAEKRPFHVVIIGAGVSGITCGYYLKQRGIPFTILEKDDQLGGTWYRQRFPGVRMDSLHVQTLFSFEPMECAPMCQAPDFLEYLVRVAKKHGIWEHIRFNEAALNANFDTFASKWTVTTSQGDRVVGDFLVNSNGYFNSEKPYIPKIFRESKFKGRMLHSFHIDQTSEDYTNKKVVLIGSGATAGTIMPELAKRASDVTLVQRSPGYLLQGDNGQFPGFPTVVKLHEKGYKLPWQIYRLFLVMVIDRALQFAIHILPSRLFRSLNRSELRKYSKLDYELIDKHFTPSYNFGEQRPVASIGYMECLREPHVHVVTSAAVDTYENGVVLENGEKIEADIVYLATGFDLEYFKYEMSMDGKKLDMYDMILRKDTWFEGVPNFAMMAFFSRLDTKNYSCLTPILENVAALLNDIIQHMRAGNYKTVVIKPLPEHLRPSDRYFPMSSTYFQRNQNRCFKALPEEHNNLGGIHIATGYPFHPADYIFH